MQCLKCSLKQKDIKKVWASKGVNVELESIIGILRNMVLCDEHAAKRGFNYAVDEDGSNGNWAKLKKVEA